MKKLTLALSQSSPGVAFCRYGFAICGLGRGVHFLLRQEIAG